MKNWRAVFKWQFKTLPLSSSRSLQVPVALGDFRNRRNLNAALPFDQSTERRANRP